jgi:uncharacterized repeat protein (TIGR01451 family)
VRRLFLAVGTLCGFGLSSFGVAASAARVTPAAGPVTISNTASVRHAKVGEEVTFTSVAMNNGPDPVEFFVQTAHTLEGLRFDSVSCDLVSNDGMFCEYSHVQPGAAVTQTVRAQVQDTGIRRATETACVQFPATGSLGPCATAVVQITGKLR